MTTALIIGAAIIVAAFIIRKSNRKVISNPQTRVESWVLLGKNIDTQKNEVLYSDPLESEVRKWYNRNVEGIYGFFGLTHSNFKLEKRVTTLN